MSAGCTSRAFSLEGREASRWLGLKSNCMSLPPSPRLTHESPLCRVEGRVDLPVPPGARGGGGGSGRLGLTLRGLVPQRHFLPHASPPGSASLWVKGFHRSVSSETHSLPVLSTCHGSRQLCPRMAAAWGADHAPQPQTDGWAESAAQALRGCDPEAVAGAAPRGGEGSTHLRCTKQQPVWIVTRDHHQTPGT